MWSTLDAAFGSPNIPSPEYNGVAISLFLSTILAEDEGWERLLANRKSSVLNVWYEDLVADTDKVAVPCATMFASVRHPTFDLARAGLQRLSAARADDWKRRFCAEYAILLQSVGSRITS